MRFYTTEAVLALHQFNIERFGGSPGIRDQGALESALNAPIDRAYYEEADEFKCAAAYGFNLCQAHAFVTVTSESRRRLALVFCVSTDSIQNLQLTKCAILFSKSLPAK